MEQQSILPRWRGFNLLGMYTSHHDGNFLEEDFQFISDLGFDFVRLPMSYRRWTKGGVITAEEVFKIDEEKLGGVDDCVRLGEKYGVHVNINLHRAPGYCINPNPQEPEPFDLWHDEQAVKAFALHWGVIAKRYKGISSKKVSFDLVNEPPGERNGVSHEDHRRAVEAAVRAIRAADPERYIIADGMDAGNTPCPELSDLEIGESCRAYVPMALTHYKASWWKDNAVWSKVEPVWPNSPNADGYWDFDRLYRHYGEWVKMSNEKKIGVHCGEGGVYIHTPHAVVLSWFENVMDILKGYNIGYALWNLRGDFGIFDSNRKDVAYEDYHGHLLDRKLLDILQRH
ncbi:MAG: cellulase family glycosylhydrolase [Clostridiales bacterium]|nr:cellulase family glycosylhydrolase [Clostridiales bacterium]